MKNIKLHIFLSLWFLTTGLVIHAQIRVIDNKGTMSIIDASKWTRIGTSNDIYNKFPGNVGIGTTTPMASLHNAGSTILGMTSISDIAVAYDIPKAYVDNYSGVVVTQTTFASSITLPEPTNTTVGRLFTICNANASTYPLTVAGSALNIMPGRSGNFVWNGIAWSAPGASISNVLTGVSNKLTSNVNGIISDLAPANGVITNTLGFDASGKLVMQDPTTTKTSVSNTSSVNSLSTTVNGVTGASVSMINSSTLSNPTVNTVRTTINNVPATTDATIIGSNTLTATTGNAITSTVNGVATTLSPAAGTITNTLGFDTGGKLVMQDPTTTKTSVSNTSSVNSLNTTVNGITGANVTMINSNALTATNGNLVSTVNGVATTPVVPVLISANNGLTAANGNVALGGTLAGSTTITTSSTNKLAIAGLQTGATTDNIVLADATGILKTIVPTVLPVTGDVTGTLGASSVDKLKGAALTYTALSDKDLLQYNSSSHWVNVTPASLVGSVLTAGTGISISGTTITNTGVISISGGTTGLTPGSASTGVVALGGILNIANGGTGISTAATPGALVYGSSATALGYTAAGTSGQVLVSGATGAPTWTSSPTGITIPINNLADATNSNSIDNKDKEQTWSWSTLAAGNALTLAANTTLANSNTQTVLNVSLSGITSPGYQTTYGARISNSHIGYHATNVGLKLSATGGDDGNYALLVPSGLVGIGTSAPSHTLDVVGDVSAKRYLTTTPAAIAAADATTVDLATGNVFTLNVAANISTLTLNNAPTQPATFVFKLSYSSNTAYTIVWPAAFLWSGGTPPTLTCVTGKTDILSIIFDGTKYYCSYALNF